MGNGSSLVLAWSETGQSDRWKSWGVMTRIIFYTKAGCHLCEKARAIVDRVAQDYPLTVELVDITQDADLYQRYWNVIPVVEVESGPTFVSKISEFRLRKALEEKR